MKHMSKNGTRWVEETMAERRRRRRKAALAALGVCARFSSLQAQGGHMGQQMCGGLRLWGRARVRVGEGKEAAGTR